MLHRMSILGNINNERFKYSNNVSMKISILKPQNNKRRRHHPFDHTTFNGLTNYQYGPSLKLCDHATSC